MTYSLATDPAKPDRANEDFAAVGTSAAVLLDGAGTPPGTRSGCEHGVAWYARTLGGLLLAELGADHSLPDALAASVDRVCALHAGTCDLEHSDTPSATVIAVRWDSSELEYLVLADSVLLLDPKNGVPEAITDDREAVVGRELRKDMDALPTGSPEHTRAFRDYAAALADHRNRPGGFWVANTDPGAAYESITGRIRIDELSAVALLSDGASRLADRFGITTWRDTLDTLDQHGPEELIRQVRQAEASDPEGRRWSRGKTHDDATAIYGHPTL
ncbi:MAG: protein phosphatase 2C domain-containing protein [Nocardiopsaceae bacterium]|nr:protein phosphatase 2C domain-containing protein [Nocardiopsaceae bacterium]